MNRINNICLIFVIFAVLSTAAVFACTTPVFQYAMQRWFPDDYVLKLPAKPIDAEQWSEDSLAALKPAGEMYANLIVEIAQEDEPATTSLQLVKSDMYRGEMTVYTAPAKQASLQYIMHSPVRQKIAEKLTTGDAATFLLILSGDEKKDKAFVEKLNKRLPELAEELQALTAEVPDAEAALLDPMYVAPEAPAVIRFSVLTMRRDDPKEQVLLSMLRPLGPEYIDSQEAVVIPVFGQGRALALLPEDYINDDMLEEIAAFLTGPCSCVVKQQNPGIDLLLAAPWDKATYELVDDNSVESGESNESLTGTELDLTGVAADVSSTTATAGLDELRQAVSEGLEAEVSTQSKETSPRQSVLGSLWMLVAGIALIVLIVPIVLRFLAQRGGAE